MLAVIGFSLLLLLLTPWTGGGRIESTLLVHKYH